MSEHVVISPALCWMCEFSVFVILEI